MITALDKFDAVIFDMDGVLIDSEPLWKIAMEETFKEIGFDLTRKDFEKTVGLRIDEVIVYWFNHMNYTGASPEETEQRIINKMRDLITENGSPLPGVVNTLNYLREQGKKIGLATSSYTVLIEAVLTTIGLKEKFDYTYSAEHEEYGKPHPAVYLHVADKLGVNPLKCLVIEDSFNGILSGKAARMTVVAIPEKTHTPDPRLVIADKEFETMRDLLNYWIKQ